MPAKNGGEIIGFHFNRKDIDRLGLFVEMEYRRDKYRPLPEGGLNKDLNKGRQLIPGLLHAKCPNFDGYFQDNFLRLYEKEPNEDRKRNDEKRKKKKLKPIKAFIPAGATKKHACPGDFFGTFSGHIEAFSQKLRPKAIYVREKGNPMTSPGKKGGPGYIDITIGKYPAYKSNQYEPKEGEKGYRLGGPFYYAHYTQAYFGKDVYKPYKKIQPTYRVPKKDIKIEKKWIPSAPDKELGGCKGGGFSLWPKYKSSPYQVKKRREVVPHHNFYSLPSPIALQWRSITNYNIDFRQI